MEALGWVYLTTVQRYLKKGQLIVLAGCFSGETQDDAYVITGECSTAEITQAYKSNAQEGDMHVWRHATQTRSKGILIYSPDTDVYNIGLPLVQSTRKYVVQINLPQYPPRYVDVNKLLLAFQHDPDLASLPQNILGSIMLQLYIVTGCDYVSYLSGFGKATFLNYFFQHADFITGKVGIGCLSQTDYSQMKLGFLAYVRLIGTVYFKKNLSTVISKLGFETQINSSIALILV